MRLERLFFLIAWAAILAVLAHILITNLPAAPEPAQRLICTEWSEHEQVWAGGRHLDTLRICANYQREDHE